MLKKIMNSLMAVALAAGVAVSAAAPAEAGHRHGSGLGIGIAAGIIGLGVGAAIADAHRHDRYYERARCYPGPEECGWRNRRCFTNTWGDTVCRGGRWTCWRPTYCD